MSHASVQLAPSSAALVPSTSPALGVAAPEVSTRSPSIREMVHAALVAVGGPAYLARQAEENPRAFLTLIGKLLAAEMCPPAVPRRGPTGSTTGSGLPRSGVSVLVLPDEEPLPCRPPHAGSDASTSPPDPQVEGRASARQSGTRDLQVAPAQSLPVASPSTSAQSAASPAASTRPSTSHPATPPSAGRAAAPPASEMVFRQIRTPCGIFANVECDCPPGRCCYASEPDPDMPVNDDDQEVVAAGSGGLPDRPRQS